MGPEAGAHRKHDLIVTTKRRRAKSHQVHKVGTGTVHTTRV